METLNWDQAKSLIDELDLPLAAAFDAVYRSSLPERRHCLTVVKASYPYGADVIRWGVAQPDQGQEMPGDYVLPTRLPLGIIARNGMEVMEAVVSRTPHKRALETRLVPQALLGRKRLIGVFELLDWKTHGTAPDHADWNITAGSRTIYATERHDTKTAATAARKSFGVEPHDSSTLFAWLADIPVFRDEIQPAWRTEVLYFSRSWFDDDVRFGTQAAPLAPSPARELYHQLLERAWPTLSRLRPNSAILYDVLREADHSGDPGIVEAAFQLLDHWTAIRGALRPCFSPTAQTDDLGPFQDIVAHILQPVLKCSSVLRPTYLTREQTVGYLKLAHIAPSKFVAQIEANLDAAVRLIARAADQAVKLGNHSAERALGWPEILNDLVFRFPPGNQKVKAPRTQRFEPGQSPPVYTRVSVDEEHFFSCYADHDLPGQRCDFFVGCMRIALALA